MQDFLTGFSDHPRISPPPHKNATQRYGQTHNGITRIGGLLPSTKVLIYLSQHCRIFVNLLIERQVRRRLSYAFLAWAKIYQETMAVAGKGNAVSN